MKKVLAILLAISVLALSACAAKQVNSDTQKDSNTAETEQKPGSEQTEQPAQEAKRVLPQKRPGSRTLLNRREKNRLRKSSSPHRRQSASSRCQKALI